MDKNVYIGVHQKSLLYGMRTPVTQYSQEQTGI